MPVDVAPGVIKKLMFFTAAMVICPLLTFFSIKQFTTNTIVSGGLAALAANLVLIGYIVVAFMEDTTDVKAESKKD
ncbi:hypothetical protein Kpol_359p4 [Vanderwaltozyma polyspora DSM 70294]|uniref:Vacuolar ATPase assembly integral membrane protein VMA21 n=1 Tax=Vanderwaltozyma polyspora (strain ATCC 22028 / DSM 70294 / BCRC 21397 / CBS 2163 / NBRC 10782 / NRRL Y-8283 / UCD 57-17) TaxID=436907 RepID=VMA21_VANPO|nr:uncharacterized protein Kpol_359p4 [Vanderwaltozyma polyspora DSM 70294]A7TSA7.1 RecName: Full=Vacuolar ATPase assembly integral membrane protein VMA21 [Vanderwaltozyma polyspora DSM 70294]EDO14844.1 hypothetical protein Kpol_359p4 [Vanderwaltozyma polyspora DSM 70294]